MIYLTLTAGLAILVFSGDLLVRGAVGLANHLGLSPLIIGLTIVSFGTSAPELVVAIEAALGGEAGLALGNVVGSNITNVLLVLGVPALLYSIDCAQNGTRRGYVFMMAITLVLIAMTFLGPIGLPHGLILLSLLVYYLYDVYRTAQRRKIEENLCEADMVDEVADAPKDWRIIAITLTLGIVGLPLGGWLTTESAIDIARELGLTSAAVGLTLVAFGTSLPELATGVMAAVRRHNAVAVGNIIGSNIFNILAIIGITALLIPLDVPTALQDYSIWVMLATSALLTPFIFTKMCISRLQAGLFVLGYIAYIYFALENGAMI